MILAPKEDFQYIKATLGLHCTHAHNLDLEQMRLSQYSAEYFQKVKFLQYLKDQADIKQNENVGTRKPHFICISAAFCKKMVRRKEIIAIFNFLIENVSEYEIAEAGIQQD